LKRGGAGKGNWGTVEDDSRDAVVDPAEEEAETAGDAKRPQEDAPPEPEFQENPVVRLLLLRPQPNTCCS
jgi:hypothetical protein